MNTELKDEKYISIPYDRWESFYKNLEVENESLKRQIEERRIDVHLRMDRAYLNAGRECIGYVDTSVSPYEFSVDGNFAKYSIMGVIRRIVREEDGGVMFKSDAEQLKKKLDAQSKEVDEKLSQMIRYRNEIADRISHLPKIIKWLFKLKNQ